MTYQTLLQVIAESGLSAEEFAKRLGLTGMTLRRWRRLQPDETLPRKYERALIDAVSLLIAEGKIRSDSPSVTSVLAGQGTSMAAVLSNFGLTTEGLLASSQKPDAMEDVLSRIGMDEERQHQVDRSAAAFAYFQSLGRAWKRRIKILRWVVSTNELTLGEKLIAYGALFYLISPVQLIPNYIPVIGLLDDYAVIVIAVAFYVRRYGPRFADVFEPDLAEA
jgi:uncharacterized membrane protein YkvA (DUF1232 family)